MYLIVDGEQRLVDEQGFFIDAEGSRVAVASPSTGVPGEVNPLIEYMTQTQFYEASKTGVEQFGERQLCIVGKPSPDPVIPGVCNTTALVAGAVVLALTMYMGGR